MKNTFFKYLGFGGLLVIAPVLVAFAAEPAPTTEKRSSFLGAPPTAPPSGNVAGVIWNLPPGSPPQDANISISGNVNTKEVKISNDLFTVDTKSLIVTSPSFGSIKEYFIKPEATTPVSGLKLNVEGALIVGRPTGYVGPSLLGKDGRIQAQKFCFNPGASSDCITSWSGGGGGGGGTSYVAKTGDTMTGGLTIQSNENQLTIQDSASIPLLKYDDISGMEVLRGGIYSNELGGIAIRGHGKTAGGSFDNITGALAELARKDPDGKSTGLYVSAVSAGDIGADITGGAYGVLAKGNTLGSSFTNSLGEITRIAYPGYGVYTDSKLYTSADLQADSNTRSSCAWTELRGAGEEFLCPANKFLSGLRKNRTDGSISAIYCCNL